VLPTDIYTHHVPCGNWIRLYFSQQQHKIGTSITFIDPLNKWGNGTDFKQCSQYHIHTQNRDLNYERSHSASKVAILGHSRPGSPFIGLSDTGSNGFKLKLPRR
jgi:hypothetical protein